jgi:hypothetical protein
MPNGKLAHWLPLYWMYHPPSSPNDLLWIHLNPLSGPPKRPNQLMILSRHISSLGPLKHQTLNVTSVLLQYIDPDACYGSNYMLSEEDICPDYIHPSLIDEV